MWLIKKNRKNSVLLEARSQRQEASMTVEPVVGALPFKFAKLFILCNGRLVTSS